ncbi:MAG: tRNA uridine-5-carboxymethylaminomethyl(34) synthesis enzyme MnmG [Clostridiales bacterium]|nr:tRNA uridine-5-carboxymethylaminomethyl(34) synthesis enzyme MnmG [Clostridiales bacterium]
MYNAEKCDIIVVGAGHAGAEAALAAARMGMDTILFTINMDAISLMACNPAIGGTAKGHLVREVDALGGQMALCADETFLQIKMLNTAKGPAVHSLRSQQDKKKYQAAMKRTLENTDNLRLAQGEVVRILEKGGRAAGVATAAGGIYAAKAVVLATGVYLKGRVIIGEYSASQGPSGLAAANLLSRSLLDLGFDLQRFKTGTPARVDARSIDFSKTIPQYGDEKIVPFSFLSGEIRREQAPCYLTYTNEKTHEIIRQNIHRSPLYSGMIDGVGPRYCPSIEDKVVKFPDKDRHQIFLEPEGADTNEIYVQGMSSSLPEEVQKALYRTVPGLSNVHFVRTAYAIEYDCIDPTQLHLSLETKKLPGLFCAGQINGTSGYEEAAAQGLLAGMNAALQIKGRPPVVLGRADAYAGVLVDDIVTKGTAEPYRMMTYRAEYRLLLRQDNADERLTQIGRDAGLVSDERYDIYMKKMDAVRREMERLRTQTMPARDTSALFGGATRGMKLSDLLARPDVTYGDIARMGAAPLDLPADVREQAEIRIKYAGYIKKQEAQVGRFRSVEGRRLPPGFDYAAVPGLRTEARAKLNAGKPENIGQASRISGVSPADISVLMVYFSRGISPGEREAKE